MFVARCRLRKCRLKSDSRVLYTSQTAIACPGRERSVGWGKAVHARLRLQQPASSPDDQGGRTDKDAARPGLPACPHSQLPMVIITLCNTPRILLLRRYIRLPLAPSPPVSLKISHRLSSSHGGQRTRDREIPKTHEKTFRIGLSRPDPPVRKKAEATARSVFSISEKQNGKDSDWRAV